MSLKIQLLTLIYSFLFGIFFGIMLKLNSKFLYSDKKVEKILTSLLFTIVNVLLYFIVLKKINNAILHPYSILILLLGFFVEYYVERKILFMFERKNKKWYNYIGVRKWQRKK